MSTAHKLIALARARVASAQLALEYERERGEAADRHKVERLVEDINREASYIADRSRMERGG